MKKRAFTLIELAIVITIIGLLIGGSFKVMKMMRERAKTTEAKDLVLGAKNAVLGDALKNYDLGLPDTAYFQDNLSLSKDLNHPMFYAPASNLVGSNICAFTATDLNVSNKGSDIPNIAFVVAHEGANYNMQTKLDTAVTPNVVTIHGADEQVDDNTTPVNIVEFYDDIVEWVTLDQLKDEVGCVDRPFRFVTDKLPNAKVGVQYSTTKLEVENNISVASITCNPSSDNNISFDTSNNTFSGEANASGTIEFDCNATVDANNQEKSITKKFVITIDPNYNKETNASCALDSECGGGYCVNNQCSSGLSGNVCVDGGDCVSGYCAGGICTTGSAGASCDNDGNCQSGICVSGRCQTGAFDAPCVDNYDCKSGICQGGLCSGYLGDLCTANNQCLSGYCDANSSTCASIPYDTNGSSGGGSGGGGGGGSGSAPSCMLAGSPLIVNNNQTTTLSYSITNGPASGTFTPSGGSCTSFTNSTGGSCTSANLTRNTSFVLSISNAYGSGSCNTGVCVATKTEYRIYNNTGVGRYFKVDGNCRKVNNGSEITTTRPLRRLNSGETIIQYSSGDRNCNTQEATIDFNQAVCADNDADGLVNFTGSDR